MRVTVLQQFQGLRDTGGGRQLLHVGEQVTLNAADPHSQWLVANGYAKEIKAEPVKQAESAKPSKADKAEKP